MTNIKLKKYTIELDGNKWCATNQDFINLQESIAGWGASPHLALSDLFQEEERIAE